MLPTEMYGTHFLMEHEIYICMNELLQFAAYFTVFFFFSNTLDKAHERLANKPRATMAKKKPSMVVVI